MAPYRIILADDHPIIRQGIKKILNENPDLEVFGYFGVVNEQAKRWYFSRTDLSYPVANTWRELCMNPNILPAAKAQCYSCFNYGKGIPTNVKPFWWED